ncbi:MAG: hypothetical protein M1484_05160 [Patescibacteria group bacterium]|nr:hypothetical protein [Patescibacteria group bacterium]MCL5432443.1 hypothetical protein [Patescibacteria group bacterium]
MFKNLIAPVQAWLLSQGKCVGCGMVLAKAKRDGNRVVCKCKRVYVDEGNGKFRRAKLEEV